MDEQKNILLAIVLSAVILIGWEVFFGSAFNPPPQPAATTSEQGMIPTPGTDGAAPITGLPGDAPPPALPGDVDATREALISGDTRIKINTPHLHGSISLVGAIIDDITLIDYRQELDPESPEIELLEPKGAKNAYFAQYGWVGSGFTGPDDTTQWAADHDTLTPESPVTLTWDNGEGLTFTRKIAVDNDYMFTITQAVQNSGDAAVTANPYGLVARSGTPKLAGFYILHEGPLGVFNGTLEERDYEEVRDERRQDFKTTGGWIGITDKYWLTALIPDQTIPVTARMTHNPTNGTDRYQVDFIGQALTIAPGAMQSVESRFFAGAKEVRLLDGYAEKLGIVNFDLAIDFGWFFYLTKPMFYALKFIHDYVGNMGIAILVLTVAIKLVFFPLANKSYRAMGKLKKLQPEMKKLQERFADDKQRLNQEMMALYKKEGANPASGCLPIFVQIPVFFALYKVLYVNIEMRHAPFFGWVQDLSAPDPTTLFNLFGLIPWDPPSFLMIGVWPLIMGVTMFLQQKLNPAPADPTQAKIMMALPFVFTFMLAPFPAGLVVYWFWNTVLSILQQWVIMKRMGDR
ncbi:MAG: membrane protein insertase YidC [Magnetospiraceae bacterium]